MSKAAIELKSQKVEEIKDKLSRAKSVVIVDYRGLTVSEDTQLRKEFRAAGVEYKVLKNTMVSRAAADLGIKDIDGMLEGPSIELYKQILADFPDMHLIASGGVSCIEDIIQLEIAKVPAVVFGKALYEGKITLKELNRFM